MNIIAEGFRRLKSSLNWLLRSRVRIGLVLVLLLLIGYFSYKNISKSTQVPTYQTAQAEVGTLITSVSASGQVTTANNVQITIQSSGVVNQVLVKNGDQVSQGQNIATLTLDQASQQKQAAAWASYLGAKASLDSAEARINSLQAAEFAANQKFINDAVERTLLTTDPTYIQENATWLQAEADYKNQQGQIAQARASLNSASLTLSQTSSTITAPVAGTVKGLTITPGAIVTLSSSSTSSTSTSQVLGSIYQLGPTQALVNISEIDAVSVAEGQKATLTMDAFPNQSFTGRLVSINTTGVSSSGVTTYPSVISFDTDNNHIYPNMAVTAKIITKVKPDVILVPTAAIQTANNQSVVRVMQNGTPQSVSVVPGDSNDTQTEITSGLKEGDVVVTGTSAASSTTTTTGNSPFGAARGFGGFGGAAGGGGAARVGR